MFRVIALLLLILLAASGCTSAHVAQKIPVPDMIHPIFHTSVSGSSPARPAIQIDIKDATEDFLFTAELYLSVQSSRFPSNTRILMPLNVGDFAGARTRFVQLPFEVREDETLLFNLLDNDGLSHDQEQMVLKGCRATGYCLLIGGEVYCPGSAALAQPVVNIAAQIIGEAIVQDIALHYFENFGTAEYIVPRYLPGKPHQANELSIRNEANYVPAVLKIYGPAEELEFSYEGRTST